MLSLLLSVWLLYHSQLHNITLVVTKVHLMLRSFVVVTWMCERRRISGACDIMELYKVNVATITRIASDDGVMCASMWFGFFGGLFQNLKL